MVPDGPLPESETGSTTITLLSVGPNQDDYDTLECLVPGRKWAIHQILSLSSALSQAQKTNHYDALRNYCNP